MICVSVLEGSTFSRDALDQQIFANRASIEDDRSLSDLHFSNAGFAAKPLNSVASKNGLALGQDRQPLPALAANDPVALRSSGDGEIALEVTDLLRAEEPLRSAIAGKNVAIVGQFVRGSTETKFRLTRMFIWCCAADARPIYVRVEVSAPVNLPDMQWVKVVGKPEYSIRNGHAHLVVKADNVVPLKPPKDVMLY